MNFVLLQEAVAIGVLSSMLSPYVPNAFLFGFLLHLLCELLGVNKWYCKNGNACQKKPSKSSLKTTTTQNGVTVTPTPKSVKFGTTPKNTTGKVLQTIENIPLVGPLLEPLAEMVLAIKAAFIG
ncbi:MAG: hypothetical protein CMM25_04115 [Rhodospirillaceae bacterium]|nr:hypothetical protein [Rhodospirillaceae bacterium]